MYIKLLPDIRVSRNTRKQENTSTSWVFAFIAHTLMAIDWMVTLIGPRVLFI